VTTPRRLAALGAVAVAVLVVGAVALAVTQGRDADDLRAERDERREVARVAAAFGEAYLSYDFEDVDASSERVLALTTAAFAEDFEATRAPGIEAVFADIETSTRATTTDVYVGDIGEQSARALVVVDVEAESAAAGVQSMRNLSFVVLLERHDGTWLVDAVEPPPSPDVDGGSTTTTMPPP
jgi:Mce-associated membrane protein